MSRAQIGAVSAAIVAVLTGAAYALATYRLKAEARSEMEARVARADRLLAQIGTLQAFDVIARARRFANDPGVRTAVIDAGARGAAARAAIARFLSAEGHEGMQPDFVAVLDEGGEVVAADSSLPDADDLKSRFPAVAAAIDGGQASKDIWRYGKGTDRVGVAPVLGERGRPAGAVVLGYAVSARAARTYADLLGTDVAFFSGDRVVASSLKRADLDDLTKRPALRKLAAGALAKGRAGPAVVEIGGERYVAAAGALPLSYADRSSGALVLTSLERGALAGAAGLILVLGACAVVVTLFAILATARAILRQSDDIEAGVAEVINGDVGYAFRPVGADLDGLANGLNVMLARLLGRPEPGADADADGDATGRSLLEEVEGVPVATDSQTIALAQEPEVDYRRRLFEEYVAARRTIGAPVEGLTFETFSAKLRDSEMSLKKKYNCRAVRFKVQIRDDHVSLKPVPIV